VDMTPPAAAAADGASTPEESIPQDEKARRLAEIQNGIKEGEARLADLDKRLAFMANPYLPPPQLTPDEIAAQKGMSQKDAYRALEAEKAALVEKLSGLRADLEKVAYVLVVLDYVGGLPGPDDTPIDCNLVGRGGALPGGEQPCIEPSAAPRSSPSPLVP